MRLSGIEVKADRHVRLDTRQNRRSAVAVGAAAVEVMGAAAVGVMGVAVGAAVVGVMGAAAVEVMGAAAVVVMGAAAVTLVFALLWGASFVLVLVHCGINLPLSIHVFLAVWRVEILRFFVRTLCLCQPLQKARVSVVIIVKTLFYPPPPTSGGGAIILITRLIMKTN